MSLAYRVLFVSTTLLCAVGPATAQSSAAQSANPGAETLARKCFQCHAATMWSSLKQDRRAWEAVLYRMVGRGALWTEDEIKAMADALVRTNGPAAASSPKPTQK